MPNPTLQRTFGRDRLYAGTGDVNSYFPPPPNLSGLNPYLMENQPPEFVDEDTSYDPQADFSNIVGLGFSPAAARSLLPLSQQLYRQQAQRSAFNEAQGALKELKNVDYGSPQLSNHLLKIFQKYPNSRKSPEVLDQVSFFSKLKPQAETFDVESIDDPIAYSYAKKNGLDKLPPGEARRKLALHATNRDVQAKALESGMSPAELEAAMDADAGAYDPIKLAQLQRSRATELELIKAGLPIEEFESYKDPATGMYDMRKVYAATARPKTMASSEAMDIARLEEKAAEERAMMLSDENKLAYLQKKYAEPERTNFAPEDWDEAFQAMSVAETPASTTLKNFIERVHSPKVQGKPTSQSTEPDKGASNVKDGAYYVRLAKEKLGAK